MDTPPPAMPEPTPNSPVPAPPTPPVNAEEKQWKVILHLSALSGFVIPCGNIIGPLVVWLIKKPEMPGIETEGRKVLNFQISYTIYMILAALSFYICVGIVVFPAVFIAWLIFLIIGAIKVSNGENYEFPLTIKML